MRYMHCKAPVSFRFVSESKRVGESTCKRNGRSPILTNPDAMVSSEDTLFTVHKLHIFRLSKNIICKDTKARNISYHEPYTTKFHTILLIC